MFWLWLVVYIVGGLALVVAMLGFVLYRIGRAMPEEHSHACLITLHKPAAEVYESIANVANWPAWDPGVNRVEGQTDSDGVFRGKMFMGRNLMGVESRRVQPPTRHEIRVEDLKMKIFSGVWRYELTPKADGCTVKLTEDGRIHAAIPRVMARKLFDPMLYMKRHLKLLAKKYGEDAEIS